jgi:S-DNA-T family DNA segregation ATPase FtsK/SpoIIIE
VVFGDVMFVPNEDWQTICRRGRALREAEGILTGHAAGRDTAPVLDHSAAVKAIGAGQVGATWPPGGLPEPLGSVAEYLGDELVQDGREFVPTAELAAALEVEPKAFAQQMGELGCRPTRYRMPTDDVGVRQV